MMIIVNNHDVEVDENQVMLFSDSTDSHKSQVKHTRVADLTVSLQSGQTNKNYTDFHCNHFSCAGERKAAIERGMSSSPRHRHCAARPTNWGDGKQVLNYGSWLNDFRAWTSSILFSLLSTWGNGRLGLFHINLFRFWNLTWEISFQGQNSHFDYAPSHIRDLHYDKQGQLLNSKIEVSPKIWQLSSMVRWFCSPVVAWCILGSGARCCPTLPS